MFHFCISVTLYWNEPLVRHGALHTQCLFCLHVTCGNTPQCYRILLWLPQSVRHGETSLLDNNHAHERYKYSDWLIICPLLSLVKCNKLLIVFDPSLAKSTYTFSNSDVV